MRSRITIQSRQQQRGITLIEVLVSMVIFSVGILGMSALQLRVLQQTHDQNQRDVAIWKAQAFMDRITLNTSAAALTAYSTSVNNDNFCATVPTVVCAETYDIIADTEVAATVCTATEMATYDTWEILCSDNEGLNDELATLDPDLTCENAPCAVGDELTLVLSWESYASASDPRLTGNTTIIRGDNTSDEVAANVERYRQVFVP